MRDQIYCSIKYLEKLRELDISSYWMKKELRKPLYEDIAKSFPSDDDGDNREVKSSSNILDFKHRVVMHL